MSLTIAYLTPRYTIGRFPKEEGPVRDTRITRSIDSGSDLLKSVQTTCQWACWTCRQLRDGASFDSCCFMPAGRGTPLPPVATRAAQAIAHRLAVASDGPTSETCEAAVAADRGPAVVPALGARDTGILEKLDEAPVMALRSAI